MRLRTLFLLAIATFAASQSTFSQQGRSSQFLFIDSLLAKDSYQVEVLSFDRKVRSVQSTGSVKVNRQSNVITFTTTDNNLKFIESLKIDCQNETVMFRNDTVPYFDEMIMPATSLLGNLRGYTWLKTSSGEDENGVIIIDKQTSNSIQVDLAKDKNTDKILLHINCKAVRPRAQYNIACNLN
ncbi:hypothetical protein A4H97_10400 [Niastella yeongjuensis]|uniref:Uncharacterized protein n=1 Tax=Niastella yeongjuensis TaxID=354355 RepID=A0A1V9EF67_9BACT|nr:hypothetical protein [Niastella yeongjuensis]OQP44763.1 hypothetical protein A4H97_10400 [Niastella yeongjuensis]SEP42626.1 hypothetical protein SAMN05660816_06022 [Niastella yeongjuensis]